MKKEIMVKLSNLANTLDELNFTEEADSLTIFMTKVASHPDHEVSMAKNELSTAMRAIKELMEALPEDETDLPAWWQNKLSRACNMIDGLSDYFKSEKEVTASSKYEGKTLNKPFRTPGGPKKFSVYVKNEKGNVVKVNFGDPGLRIKDNIPGKRKNFRARHRCDSDPRAKDKTTAKYWSCRQWSDSKSDI